MKKNDTSINVKLCKPDSYSFLFFFMGFSQGKKRGSQVAYNHSLFLEIFIEHFIFRRKKKKKLSRLFLSWPTFCFHRPVPALWPGILETLIYSISLMYLKIQLFSYLPLRIKNKLMAKWPCKFIFIQLLKLSSNMLFVFYFDLFT